MKRIHPISDIKYYFKHNKLTFGTGFLLAVIIILSSYLGITLARYVFVSIKNGILSSNSFYFNSDKLSENQAVYQLNNWSGADSYSIIFNMNSKKNNLVAATSDISYNITFTCTSNVLCSSSKNSGIIYASNNTDSFTINIVPNAAFTDGDTAVLTVTASSTSPYIKTLSGKFTLKVGKAGLSYEIQDEANRPYLELRITNTLDYYTVKTAFGTHAVNDRLDITTYEALSDTDKANCASSIITLSFNPANTILDMTSPAYLKGYNFSNLTVNGVSYIHQFSFKMDALSSEKVNFYKTNVASNYTYPFVNDTSAITVNYE